MPNCVFFNFAADESLRELALETLPESYRHPGACCRFADASGFRGQLKILSVDGASAKIKIEERQPVPPRVPVTLICGLSRPQTMKKVLHTVAACGAQAVHFVRCERSEKSYLDSDFLKSESLESEFIQLREQLWDSYVPEVKIFPRFRPYIEDEFDVLVPSFEGRFLADFGGADFSTQLQELPKSYCVAVGPEAGWNDFEREQFLAKGFSPVSFSERMLRVEHCASGLLGAIAVLSGRS